MTRMRPHAINLPAQRAEYEGLSPWKAMSKREEQSLIIKAAVSYVCSQSTIEAGYIVDHTCDGVFAGWRGDRCCPTVVATMKRPRRFRRRNRQRLAAHARRLRR